jgi:hypothetical protein
MHEAFSLNKIFMNTILSVSLIDQIQMLTEQDLIRLRFFIDELIRRQHQRIQASQQESAVPFLANLRPLGIPGGKSPFNRALIYDDLTI